MADHRASVQRGAGRAIRGPRAPHSVLHGADAQRPRRDERTRAADRAHRTEPEPPGRDPDRVHRHRHRDLAGRPLQDLRAVLHDQAAGARHGPRPLGGLRHRGGAPRPHRGGVASRCGEQLQGVPAHLMKILVVEDDKTVGEYVRRGLDEAGYHAELVGDGDQGNGLPVLVLTAQDAVDFKVQALRMGADDYVTKPFAFEELLARVEALGRRPKAIAPPTLKVAGLQLDTGSREVTRDGKRIELTPKEYAVLEYLMRHQGRVMSRTLITEYAWDYHFDPGTNIVDVVITRLRKKIDQAREPKLIHTVRGVGYVVRA